MYQVMKIQFLNLWEKILKLNTNENLFNIYSKQLLYMTIILEYYTNKKKGIFYKKYESYLEMYEYYNMDNFPIFFDEDETYFLSPSGSMSYRLIYIPCVRSVLISY